MDHQHGLQCCWRPWWTLKRFNTESEAFLTSGLSICKDSGIPHPGGRFRGSVCLLKLHAAVLRTLTGQKQRVDLSSLSHLSPLRSLPLSLACCSVLLSFLPLHHHTQTHPVVCLTASFSKLFGQKSHQKTTAYSV